MVRSDPTVHAVGSSLGTPRSKGVPEMIARDGSAGPSVCIGYFATAFSPAGVLSLP